MEIVLTAPELNMAIREYVEKHLQTDKNPIPVWQMMGKPKFSTTEEGFNKGWSKCKVEFNFAPEDYDDDK